MKHRINFALLFTAALLLISVGVAMPSQESVSQEPIIHPDWGGTWEVTVTYRDRVTGAVVTTDVTTTSICPNEPILPRFTDAPVRCSAEADLDDLTISCRGKHAPEAGCNWFAAARLDSNRQGEVWNGTGNWTASSVGTCRRELNDGEDFVLKGRRISHETVCGGPTLSLVKRFFAHGPLVSVLAGGN